MSDFLAKTNTTLGDPGVLTNAQSLEALNCLMSVREQKDPKMAAEYLEKIQSMAAGGFPYAVQLLDQAAALDGTAGIIAKLKGGGTEAADQLKQMHGALKFLDDELDRNRIRNA